MHLKINPEGRMSIEYKTGFYNTFDEIKRIEEKYQLNTYRKLPVSIERGEGNYVYDSSGKRYIDFYGGHAVAITGHCHPHVVGAIKTQVERLLFYSNVVYSSVRAKASKMIIEKAGDDFSSVFFCNSGSEANETAMKIARRYTGKKRIIAMKNGFHGRTLGSLSATGLGAYREQFSPIIKEFDFVDFGNLEMVQKLISDDVAGIILEPIQSMAGVDVANDDYYKKLMELCTENGIVLIFDEVQTGFGRTGNWFFGQRIGIAPDIITLAKGIASGIPTGAVIIKSEIAKTIGYGEHGSTFGGGPVAMAALIATMEVIENEGLVENARRIGSYIIERSKSIKGIEPRGRGLLLGLQIPDEASKLRDFLLAKGIITGTSYKKNVLRLLPPLTIGTDEAEILLDEVEHFLNG